MFDTTLPTITSIIQGKMGNEWEAALVKTGKLALAGIIYRYCGSVMYNSVELLFACKIARENKHMEDQEKEDSEEEKEVALFEKADQV